MQHQKSTFTAPDGFKLFTQQWVPDDTPKDLIILVHGLAEHSARYTYVAEYLVQAGYAVYTLDHRGHGQSRGDTFGYFERFDTLSEDLRRYIEWARAEQKSGLPFLLGHSMGSLLALYYGIRYPTTIKGIVVSAAPVNAAELVPPTTRLLARVLSRLAPKMGVSQLPSATISKDPAVVQAYDSDPNVYRSKVRARVGAEMFAAADYVRKNLHQLTLPVLVMHGTSDQLVPPGSSTTAFNGVSSADKTLKMYDGLYHEIFNEAEKNDVLADVVAWLDAHHSLTKTGQAAPVVQTH